MKTTWRKYNSAPLLANLMYVHRGKGAQGWQLRTNQKSTSRASPRETLAGLQLVVDYEDPFCACVVSLRGSSIQSRRNGELSFSPCRGSIALKTRKSVETCWLALFLNTVGQIETRRRLRINKQKNSIERKEGTRRTIQGGTSAFLFSCGSRKVLCWHYPTEYRKHPFLPPFSWRIRRPGTIVH